ncbi:MAG: hypothetical protein AB7T06_24835 [Kofleriaceae bacterium]
MRALIIVFAGCAASPSPLPANHPATTTAPPGRVAPAPASLRAGVVAYPDVPKQQAKPPAHHHHHHP